MLYSLTCSYRYSIKLCKASRKVASCLANVRGHTLSKAEFIDDTALRVNKNAVLKAYNFFNDN